jgi:hypothetical protein
MPNGASAPGNVLPPPVVQVRVSTREAGFDACALVTGALLVDAAGRCTDFGSAGQSVSFPAVVTSQRVAWPPGSFRATAAEEWAALPAAATGEAAGDGAAGDGAGVAALAAADGSRAAAVSAPAATTVRGTRRRIRRLTNWTGCLNFIKYDSFWCSRD